MERRSPSRVVCPALFIALLGSTAALSAQTELPESGFGPLEQVVSIPFSAFSAMAPSAFSPGTHYCCDDGYQFSNVGSAGYAIMQAPIEAGLIPNGAILNQFVAYVGDSSGVVDEDIQVSLCRTWVDSATGANPGGDCPLTSATTASPGDTALVMTPGSPLQVLYRTDIDNDGQQEVVNYNVVVEFGVGTKLRNYFGTALKLRQVRLLFSRSVSPAPGAATFNDVPTNHPFFQFIQALVKSGVTSGCGNGNYCPDQPLTRGQMAVFLSKALGLSWEY